MKLLLRTNKSHFALVLILGLVFALPSSVLAENMDANLSEQENATVSTYNLKECIDRGLRVSHKVQATEQRIQKAESKRKAARGRYFPDLSASSSFQDLNSITAKGPTETDYIGQQITTLSARLSQTLFAGFTIFNSVQKARFKRKLAEARKKQTEMEMIQKIQSYFLELLKAKEEIASLEQTIERLKVNYQSAKAYLNVQMAPYLEVLQAKSDLANAKQKLSQAQNKRLSKRTQLSILLNFPPQKGVRYTGDLKQANLEFSKRLEKCMDYALNHRPRLNVAKKSLKTAKQEVDIAQGKFYPKIETNLSYYLYDDDYDEPGTSTNPFTGKKTTYDRDQKNTYWSASVKLQWKFNTGGREYYNYKSARSEVLRMDQRLKQTKNTVRTQVRIYYNSLKEAKSRIQSTQKALKTARESYHRARQRLENEMGTISEVLDSQARLRRAEANYNQALADYQLSLSKLYYAMGKREELFNQQGK